MKSMTLKKRDNIMKAALFNARMEGFSVPESVVSASEQVLAGKVKADKLVSQYKAQFSKGR